MVDWNPSGVVILSQYKWGGACNAAEEGCDPLPGLHWLAARQHQLESADVEACLQDCMHVACLLQDVLVLIH